MQVNNINIEKVLPLSDEQANFLDRHLPRVVGSDGETRPFDGTRIKNSMLKEIADLPENVAEDVTAKVTTLLLGYKMVTAPMIRELACGVLHRINPKWRFKYTRLGIPYWNFQKKYGTVFDELNIDWRELTKDDILNKVIPMINPYDLCSLIKMIGKDYLGVKKNIESPEGELPNGE
jgi:hypothetical protein